jgi:hypothetical protein
MSLIANEPSTTPADATITNDGFWPDIVVNDAKLAMRLDGTVTDARLTQALVAAVIEVARDVSAWQAIRVSLGYATAEAVPSPTIGGKTVIVQSYLRAVYCYAQADLIERMSDFDTTAQHQRTAQWLECTPDQLRRDAIWAITALMGRSRTTVELI